MELVCAETVWLQGGSMCPCVCKCVCNLRGLRRQVAALASPSKPSCRLCLPRSVCFNFRLCLYVNSLLWPLPICMRFSYCLSILYSTTQQCFSRLSSLSGRWLSMSLHSAQVSNLTHTPTRTHTHTWAQRRGAALKGRVGAGGRQTPACRKTWQPKAIPFALKTAATRQGSRLPPPARLPWQPWPDSAGSCLKEQATQW